MLRCLTFTSDTYLIRRKSDTDTFALVLNLSTKMENVSRPGWKTRPPKSSAVNARRWVAAIKQKQSLQKYLKSKMKTSIFTSIFHCLLIALCVSNCALPSEAKRRKHGFKIVNKSAFPIQVSLNQVGPLYWGIIEPGKTCLL